MIDGNFYHGWWVQSAKHLAVFKLQLANTLTVFCVLLCLKHEQMNRRQAEKKKKKDETKNVEEKG